MTTAQFVGSDMLKNIPHAVLQCLAACTAQLHTAFLYIYIPFLCWSVEISICFNNFCLITLALLRAVSYSFEHEYNYYLVLNFSSFFLNIHFYATSHHFVPNLCLSLFFHAYGDRRINHRCA